MYKKTIFSAADILLPDYAVSDLAWQKWAVIACDQFTSEGAYWAEAEAIAADAPSALHMILPEAYLGTDKETARRAGISAEMLSRAPALRTYTDTMVYLRRTLPDGRVRSGLVGRIDLEQYDYAKDSASAVRATEATVLERIPPRVAIRAEASLELPHVMLLIDDTEKIFDCLSAEVGAMQPLYDFDLMLGGGHAAGYAVAGDALAAVLARISAYESAREGKLVYAVGDGNHSLAAARALYLRIKEEQGEAALTHPARYALVELVAMEDSALDFEPIYRVVDNCDPDDLLAALAAVTVPGEGEQTVRVVTATEEKVLSFTGERHALTVGTLQNFLDAYIAAHAGASCDYIHDEASLLALARRPGSVGFLFDGMQKDELFPYVRAHGTCPRKTFSMGEARSKRYYIEARKIVK